MTIRQTGGLLRAGKISCVELMERTLSDIKHREAFNSFITVMEEIVSCNATNTAAPISGPQKLRMPPITAMMTISPEMT